MKEPVITIVIVNYNYQNYILDAINSALNQSYNEIEIIIVDHASTDGSHKYIKDYIHENKLKHKINYIRLTENNGGPSYPRNLGVEKSSGEYVICLDGDDMIHELFVEEGLLLLKKQSADILIPTIKHFGKCNNVENAYYYDKELIYFENIFPYCCIFRKSAWEKCGKYKEDLLILEDWEFYLSAAKANLEIAQLEKPYFLYRKHGSSVWDQTFGDDNRIKEEIIGIRRYHPEYPINNKNDIIDFLGLHYYYQNQQFRKFNEVLCRKVFQRIRSNEKSSRTILRLIDKIIQNESNLYN